MNLNRVWAIFLRQWFLLKSNPIRLMNFLVWSVIGVFQWGFVSKYIDTFGARSFNFTSVILGALILWEFSSRLQQTIMTGFLEDVWSRNFVNFFASPLKIREYLCGLILNSITNGVANFVFISLLAAIFFGYSILSLSLAILPFVLVLFIFGLAMGILASAVVFRFGSAAEWLAWPLAGVLSIFSAVFYPVAALPNSLQVVAKLIPTSYVFENLRASIFNNVGFSQMSHDLLIALALSLFYLLLVSWLFSSIYRRNLDKGGITRFNTESF
ncbi:MAG: ABC transporter permease [Patescibacteria group bacterium]